MSEYDSEYDTQPTIETVLERMGQMEERLGARISGLEERLGVRLDRIESSANQTRSEMLTLRADFTELRATIREHFPVGQ
jgi:uncharacterized membrane protein YccC